MRRRSRQAGFSTIGILLIVIITGLLTAGGWKAYQHVKPSKIATNTNQSTTKETTSQQTNTTPSTGSTQPTNADQNTRTFTIPELNAEMTLPEGLTPADLKYSMSTDAGVPVANFTTASLEQMDGTGSCGATQGSIGVIWRTTQNPASGSITVKQTGQYYYAFERPQGSCTGNPNAGKLEQSQTALLQQAFETIIATN